MNLSNGELYTVVTNKYAKGRKGALIAIVKGTKAKTVSEVLQRIPVKECMKVKEVTLDMANNIDWIVRECFMNATRVTDRFHAQQLVSDALQEVRIKLRWEAIEEENNAIKEARHKKRIYKASTYENGDTKKQLLARSRYLLFKPQSKWAESQEERSHILFREFPELKKAYELSMMFRSFYEHSKSIAEGKESLKSWYAKVEKYKEQYPSFLTAMNSIQAHEGTILNYFIERSTNAGAESFNAKIKGFRSLVRGVTDKKFFLYRLSKIYG